VGDFIIVGDLLGVVEHVGFKTTRIRSLHGEQLIFSNTDLTNSRIRNYKRMKERRIEFALGVVYQTPLEKMQKIPGMIQEIIQGVALARFDRAHHKDFVQRPDPGLQQIHGHSAGDQLQDHGGICPGRDRVRLPDSDRVCGPDPINRTVVRNHGMEHARLIVIISDPNGTLLEHTTDSFEEARTALL